MQTILVTGASGFVGSRFVRRWGGAYNILAPSHGELDITDAASVERYFADNRPHVVLHLAAISNTWQCEQNPADSYRVNVSGVKNLARAAALCGARFVFFSSDQVYNGNLEYGLLREDMPLSPCSVYARHKLEAEQVAADESPQSVILRATWMYDAPIERLPVHANFVENFRRMLADGTPLTFPVREYRGITWVGEVIELLPRTFTLPAGVYNFGASNTLNTYETACCYFEMLETSLKCDAMIIPDAERFPDHERNISMSNDKIVQASNGDIFFNTTLDGLRIFLEKQKAGYR